MSFDSLLSLSPRGGRRRKACRVFQQISLIVKGKGSESGLAWARLRPVKMLRSSILKSDDTNHKYRKVTPLV